MTVFLLNIAKESWSLLLESSIYILFGLFVSGVMSCFIDAAYVARHLGESRFLSIIKAALFGIPLPICSCGVIPTGVALRKQGANKGAVIAFLISTPESGVDSMAITYALLDPIMTIARPVAALITAIVAGITENILGHNSNSSTTSNVQAATDRACHVDGCCDGAACETIEHRRHHTFAEKVFAGARYAFSEVWSDLAGWFFLGVLCAGIITAAIPSEFIGQHLGHGISAMLLVLAISIPLYICASASTPIAAALILKGASPGVALVFLLAGPATNIASLTMLLGTFGKRTTSVYLTAIALLSILSGLIVDQIYSSLGLSASALIGQAADFMPYNLQLGGAAVLLILSGAAFYRRGGRKSCV